MLKGVVIFVSNQTTAERIIEAAIYLISEKGYKAATTKAIAERAGVNEVTLFRHFGNKRGILKAIIEKFSYGPLLQQLLQEKVTWDLEADLFVFAKEYQNYMMSIKEYVLIAFKEAGAFPEIDEELANVPLTIKKALMNYFMEMLRRGKLMETNIEAVTMSFIALNFGFFFSKARLGTKVSELSQNDVLQTSVLIFSRGLAP